MSERIETILAALGRDAKAGTTTQRAVLDVVHQHTGVLAQILTLVKAEPEGSGVQSLTDAVTRLAGSIDQQTAEIRALRQGQDAFQQALSQQIGTAVADGIDTAINGTAAQFTG